MSYSLGGSADVFVPRPFEPLPFNFPPSFRCSRSRRESVTPATTLLSHLLGVVLFLFFFPENSPFRVPRSWESLTIEHLPPPHRSDCLLSPFPSLRRFSPLSSDCLLLCAGQVLKISSPYDSVGPNVPTTPGWFLFLSSLSPFS